MLQPQQKTWHIKGHTLKGLFIYAAILQQHFLKKLQGN
jgi:hypothetical protein